MTLADQCDHPLAERRVYGNPDPHGERIGGQYSGVSRRFKMDAECEICGAHVPVDYALAEEASKQP